MAQTTEVETDERAMRVALYDYTYRFSRSVELASKRMAKRGGFFAREAADSVVHEALKVVAKT